MILTWFMLFVFACPMPVQSPGGGKLPLNPPGGRVVITQTIFGF